MNWNRACVGLGIALIVFGILMPQSWYDPLPQKEVVPPPPFSGYLLLQLSFVVEGGLLTWFGLRRWKFVPIDASDRLNLPSIPQGSPNSTAIYLWLVVGISILGLGLRLISLDSQLWLDEITPILDYRNASLWQVVISDIRFYNHPLNTLLVKLCIAAFGEREWAIRLPAVIFGTATIPVMCWLARQVMPRWASLSAALLLAVSYHYIFFSQNARGYTAYVFFSLVSSVLLSRGMQKDEGWVWGLYIIATALNFTTILISGFVFGAQILAAIWALMLIKQRGGSPLPLFKRLFMVFAIAGYFGFQFYAVVLPQLFGYLHATYSGVASQFTLFSPRFVAEIISGAAVGLGVGLLFIFVAAPFLLIAGLGYLSLIRQHWVLMVSLSAPALLLMSFVAMPGFALYPRFFILALPLAILAAIRGINIVSAYGAQLLKFSPAVATCFSVGLVGLATLASLASLPHYYTVPKQAYLSSLAFLETTRRPDDIVIVIYLADGGIRYYAERFHIQENRTYFYVRSLAAFDQVLTENSGRRSWLLVTFPRALHLDLPDLEARIQRDWIVAQEFPGTVGDGDITVWQQRQP